MNKTGKSNAEAVKKNVVDPISVNPYLVSDV